MGSCLATFDQFAVNFLKAKQLKTFPGGVFSLIVKIFNISVLVGCLVFYFLQSSQISVNYQSSQFNSDIPSFTPKESTINITISQYGSPMDQSQIDYIYSYFKMVVYSRNNNDIIVNLIRPEFINNAIQFTIPNDVLNVNITEVNFPRISLESCATLQSFINSAYFKFNESDLTEINSCNSNLNEFYENAYIKNKVFIYKITTLHHQLTKDYELKSDIRNISYPFTFQNETHDVFVTERKKIAVLFDNSLFKTNKNYDYYLNWANPSKATIQHWFNNYNIQLIISEQNKYEIMTYKIHKVAFMTILPWVGSFSRFISCLSAIPALWYGYYTSLIFAKMYYQSHGINPKEDTSMYDWDKMTYCQWVKMKFRCGTHAKKLNNEIVRMRKDLAENYEKLFKKKPQDISSSNNDLIQSVNEME